jgi:hypothetical protein
MKPLHQYEPWKVMTIAFAIGMILPVVVLVIGVLIMAHFIK